MMSVQDWPIRRSKASFSSNESILYIGTKLREPVQDDVRTFCPELRFVTAESVDAATLIVEGRTFRTVILDSEAEAEEVMDFLETLRYRDGPNAVTPIRIIDLHGEAWVGSAEARFYDVVAIRLAANDEEPVRTTASQND